MLFSPKTTLAGILLSLLSGLAFSQSAVRVDSFPQPLQLYQRGAGNIARVAVTGSAPSPYTQVSLTVLRNAARYYYQKQQTGLTGIPGSFSFSPGLRADSVEYSFSLYAHTSPTDSIMVGRSDRVVCGDVLILYGQSNVVALNDIDGYVVNDRLLRNFTYPYLSTDIPGQVAWSTAKQPYGSVGGIGIWLQKLILERYGIPTCVMNGGVGGTPISTLSLRDAGNHANLNTLYGLLLYRAQRAQLASKARIIVYKQGEADAAFNTDHYDEALRTLTNQFEEDYPAVKKIYVSQLNILADPMPRGGEIRDAQRRATQQTPLIETIATVGTPTYDGVHYLRAGNQQIAGELFRQIARDFYGETDTLQINSPNIRTARYNARRDTITLTFGDQMRLVWPRDSTITNSSGTTYTRRLIDFIYLDGQAGAIVSGVARRNQVLLALREPSTVQTITYLPSFFSDEYSPFYDGVHLKNERGMRAFSFDKFLLTTVDAPRLTQVISVTAVPASAFSEAPVSLTARASSGLPVRYEVVSGPGVMINSHQVRFSDAGVITIKATQAGDEQFLPAADVWQSLTVTRGRQYIGELVQTGRSGAITVSVSATASSGLPVTYTLTSGPATLTGNQLLLTDYGQVTLQLAQPGDTRYEPAATISQTICVNPLKPVITTDSTTSLVLISSSPFRNQWFIDGDSIRTGTQQKLTVEQAGGYRVTVINPMTACQTSAQSDLRTIVILATEPVASATRMQVYPNPATEQVRIRLPVQGTTPTLQLVDNNGRIVADKLRFERTPDGYEATVSVRAITGGVYLLRATTSSGPIVSRILVRP